MLPFVPPTGRTGSGAWETVRRSRGRDGTSAIASILPISRAAAMGFMRADSRRLIPVGGQVAQDLRRRFRLLDGKRHGQADGQRRVVLDFQKLWVGSCGSRHSRPVPALYLALSFPAPGGLPAPVSGPTSPFRRHTGCAPPQSLPPARSRPKRGTRGRLPANMAGGTLLRKDWARGVSPQPYAGFILPSAMPRQYAASSLLAASRRSASLCLATSCWMRLSTPEGPAPWSFGVSGAGWGTRVPGLSGFCGFRRIGCG